jgi:hypothetical protein
MPPITSEGFGKPAGPSVRYLLDGVVKSAIPPITGKSLYAQAGEPAELHGPGGLIKKNNDPVNLTQDAKLSTKHYFANSEAIPQSMILPGGRPGVTVRPDDADTKQPSPVNAADAPHPHSAVLSENPENHLPHQDVDTRAGTVDAKGTKQPDGSKV